MALIHKIFGRKKSLSDLDWQALRKEEILIGKQRDKLFAKSESILTEKRKIFEQGAAQKSPELRKSLAMNFEMKTQEQLMVARELNLRTKELMTVSRLRMIQENKRHGDALGRLNVTDRDVGRISQWIEDDAVSTEMYQQRLDQVLELGHQADQDALAAGGLTSAGQELMHIWDDLDRGAIKQQDAFTQADTAARRRVEMEGQK
jgi:hypothetical protein